MDALPPYFGLYLPADGVGASVPGNICTFHQSPAPHTHTLFITTGGPNRIFFVLSSFIAASLQTHTLSITTAGHSLELHTHTHTHTHTHAHTYYYRGAINRYIYIYIDNNTLSITAGGQSLELYTYIYTHTHTYIIIHSITTGGQSLEFYKECTSLSQALELVAATGSSVSLRLKRGLLL